MKYVSITLLLLSIVYALSGCQSITGSYQWSNGVSEGTIQLKKIPDQIESENYIKDQFDMPKDEMLPSPDGLPVAQN